MLVKSSPKKNSPTPQPQIQFGIRRDKQEIQIRVGPERAYFGLELGIVELQSTIFLDPRGSRVRPDRRVRIRVEFRRFADIRDGERGHRRRNLAYLHGQGGDWDQQDQ